MKDKFVYIFIVILVTAVGIGYFIYKKSPAEPGGVEVKEDQVFVPRPLQSFQDLEGVASEEEVAILTTPGPDATDEERQRHFELVQGFAQVAPYLDITKCSLANPIVFLVESGEMFNVRNDDSIDHTIIIDKEYTFIIPAGKTKGVMADFGKGPGIYGYGCDFVPHAVGILLLVTEPL